MDTPQVKVGVGVLILKDGKVLISKRKGSHGEGEYSFPGGHLEPMESIEECAKRETAEECGIEIDNVRFQFVSNVTHYAPKHYLHIGVIADWKSGEPQVMEPDKAESWEWFDPNQVPEPIFHMVRQALEAYRTGQIFFDSK